MNKEDVEKAQKGDKKAFEKILKHLDKQNFSKHGLQKY